MKALFLYESAPQASVALRAGEAAKVGVTCAPAQGADLPAGGFDAVIVPEQALEAVAKAGLVEGARIVVYGRGISSAAERLPPRAVALDAPFRIADLAAVLSRIGAGGAGPTGGQASPASPAAATKVPGPAAPAAAPPGARGYRILAVDDDRVIRKLYSSVLGDAGHTVLVAEDGEDAWEKLPAFGPDLVLSDVEMPRLTGYELCRRIKEHPQWAQIPVIICSSLSQGRDVVKAFESGTDDYLIKPINEEELLTRVAELLASIEQAGRESILVADDSRIIRNLIKGGLQKQGFEVETAEDGRDALDKLGRMDPLPAIVISDFEMPGMTGFDLGMAMRASPRTSAIPLIMMSARDDTRNRRLMRTAGARGFLGKPFEPDKMVALVERVIAEERLRAEKARIRELIADDAMAQVVRDVRLGRKSSARAERMTLLFSDLKGFCTMCGRMTAPEVVDLLNAYFDTMIPPIRENGGDVDKFIGDAIMARFREPEEGTGGDPSPLRAVRAAIAMQEALVRFDGTRPENRQLHMRIGINTGEVVIGAIGASSRRDYTTIGDNVNRAQRLESNARVDGVLISEFTYDQIKDRIDAERRPEKISLKGIGEPIWAYDVLGLRKG